MEKMSPTIQRVDDSSFRLAIQQQLRSDGVYDEIIARLRANILLSLCNPKEKKTKIDNGLEEVAWQSLVYHYLGEKKFLHTLSVYSAECGMEGRSNAHLTLDDCMRALGLFSFWNELKNKQDDGRDDGSEGGISTLLRCVGYLSSSTQRYSAEHMQFVSVSIQTESVALTTASESTAKNDCVNHISQHLTSLPKNTNMTSMEQRVIDMERDLRHEMNEKLRVSAKKQAMQITRRLEEEHKEEVTRMQNLIDAERVKSQQVQREWREKFSLQEVAMEKERSEMSRKLEKALIAKETLESDMSLIYVMKKKEMEERARELDSIDEQKRRLQSEINEAIRQQDAIQSTELRCASLQSEKDSWLSEREELHDEIKLLHKQLTSAHKAKDIVEHSLAQLKSNHVKQFQTHHITENSLQSQLRKLEEKYQTARSDLEKTILDLETARNEVTSLHTLLRQTKSALESVTFRGEDDAFKHGNNGYRTNNLRHLGQSEFSRNSVRVCGNTGTPPLSTQSFQPKLSSSISHRSGPDLDDDSSNPFENTTFKLFGVGEVSDAKQWNRSLMPQIDSTNQQPMHSFAKLVDNIHHARDDHQISPEDPPSYFAGDPPDGKSLVENDDTRNKNMIPSVRTASFIHEQAPTAKNHNDFKNQMNAIIHDQHDDVLSKSSEAIGQRYSATEQAYSSEIVELTDKRNRSDSSATQHGESVPYEQTASFFHQDNVTGLRDKGKKEIRCTADDSVKMPLSSTIVSVAAPDATFLSHQYSESFQSENEQKAAAAGEKEPHRSNENEVGKQVGADSGNAMAKNYQAHKMTNELGSPISFDSEQRYPRHREMEIADIDTQRSISSTSSDGYTASFYTED